MRFFKFVVRDWPRRLRQVIIFLMLCVTMSSIALVFGCWMSDRAIDRNLGQAVASVRHVDALRTAVDFVDEQGEYRSPPTGLRYPVGLEEGQRVRVEYDTTDPDIVRVAGRRWTLSVIPALSVFFVGLVVASLLWWLSVRATLRLREDSLNAIPGSPEGRVGV